MWCGRKGIDCPDCGTFGECLRTVCGLPDRYHATVGNSSDSYSFKYWSSTNNPIFNMPDELYINGIKYVKEK